MTLFDDVARPDLNKLAVLMLFKREGRMTDADLRIHFNNAPNTLRRRVELLEDHLLEIVGDTRNPNGNRVLIFAISEEGTAFLEGYGL